VRAEDGRFPISVSVSTNNANKSVHHRGTENTEAPKVKAFFHHEAHEEHEDGINRGEDNAFSTTLVLSI
jgi:hypothetical protein